MSSKTSEPISASQSRARRVDQASAIVWLLVGAAIVNESRKLDYEAEFGFGPGFLPFWVGLSIVVLALLLLAQSTLKRSEAELEFPSQPAARQIALVAGSLFIFALLAAKVGFLVCVFFLFVFLLMVVERKRWRFSLIISAGSTFVFWAVFEGVAQMQLPRGILDLLF